MHGTACKPFPERNGRSGPLARFVLQSIAAGRSGVAGETSCIGWWAFSLGGAVCARRGFICLNEPPVRPLQKIERDQFPPRSTSDPNFAGRFSSPLTEGR